MSSYNICPTCNYYDSCKELDWDGTDTCRNYEPMQSSTKEKVIKDIYNGQSFMLWDEVQGYSVGTLAEDLLEPKTLQITGCERIILKDKSLDFQFELTKGKIEEFDEIIINGIKFKRISDDNI